MGFGIALGGLAEGFQAGQKMQQEQEELKLRQQTILQDKDLRTKALGLQERALKAEENRDLLSQADKIIGDQLKIVSDVVKAGKEANHTPEQIAAAIEPIMADVDRLSSAVGRDSSAYRNQVQGMLTMPSGVEAATAKGTAEAATSKAMAAAGVSDDNVVETIKLKIARGDPLTPGEERLYTDSVHKSGNALAEALKPFLGEDAEKGEAPAVNREPTVNIPAPAPTQTSGAAPPPIPKNLVGTGAKWSPKNQRWYTPDGASFNRQGVPG